ncbi:bacillithiol biosynthesis cysteine-adding enzyme BshC [Bacillus carboniphilus]|uniref:Putative cysteine ligase BshC n=1 Tax=Bacillus carboniphilus TaxID=86663 RepID=A0ABN0WAP3_9BACI
MQIFRHNGIAGNQLAQDYINKTDTILSLFPYQYGSHDMFKKRWDSVMNRSYPRQEVSEAIQSFMEPFGLTPEIENSLHKLRNAESTVIIGGQQAGFLSGPLYTIHKIVAIIKQAASAEKELGKPVVPIFWIAGEDHDYEEVNHVFIRQSNNWDKKVYPEKILKKKMVSDITFDSETCKAWVTEILKQLGESPYTRGLQTELNRCIEQTTTITEFFTAFIHTLFKEYGLLLIDACHPVLRKLEMPLFQKLVEEGHHIATDIRKDQAEIEELGYTTTLDLDPNTIHMFVTVNGERELLLFDQEQGKYYTKNSNSQWTKEQLNSLIEESPHYFSNNVATRPISQECLFPTLGFIGGPGEIAYWAELRAVFNRFDLDMAPVIPRLQITYLEKGIMKKLEKYQVKYETVIQSGIGNYKKEYLETFAPTHIFQSVENTAKEIRKQYDGLLHDIRSYDKGLLPIIHKNEKFVLDQLHFLEEHVWGQLEKKNQKVLQDLDEIEAALRPFNGLQERVWNVCYFINQYDFDWFKQMMSLELESGGNHYIVSF